MTSATPATMSAVALACFHPCEQTAMALSATAMHDGTAVSTAIADHVAIAATATMSAKQSSLCFVIVAR